MFIDKTNLVYPEGSVYQPASFHRMYPKCFKRFPVCFLSPQHSLTPWALEIIQRDIIVEPALGNLTVISKRARRHSRRNSRLNSQQQPQFYQHRAMSLSYVFPCTFSMAARQDRSCLFGRTLYPEFHLLQVDVQDASMSVGSACTD